MRKYKILFIIFFAVFLIASIAQTITIEESVDIEGVGPGCSEQTVVGINFDTDEIELKDCAAGQQYDKDQGQLVVQIDICCNLDNWFPIIKSATNKIYVDYTCPSYLDPVPGITVKDCADAEQAIDDIKAREDGGSQCESVNWTTYMPQQAIVDHENGHTAAWKKLLSEEWPGIQKRVELNFVPITAYPNPEDAKKELSEAVNKSAHDFVKGFWGGFDSEAEACAAEKPALQAAREKIEVYADTLKCAFRKQTP